MVRQNGEKRLHLQKLAGVPSEQRADGGIELRDGWRHEFETFDDWATDGDRYGHLNIFIADGRMNVLGLGYVKGPPRHRSRLHVKARCSEVEHQLYADGLDCCPLRETARGMA
jgi:hypothetical protein